MFRDDPGPSEGVPPTLAFTTSRGGDVLKIGARMGVKTAPGAIQTVGAG